MKKNSYETNENSIPNANVKTTKERNVPDLRFAAGPIHLDLIKDITVFHKQGYYTTEKYNTNSNYYLFSGSNFINHTLNYESCNKINVSKKDFEAFKIEKGDILLVRSGSVGDYAVVDSDVNNAIFGSYLIKFNIDNSKVMNQYFCYFYESQAFKKQLKKITQASANTNINADNIKSVLIHYPDLLEQQIIVDFLSLIDKKIVTQKKIINRKISLMYSIINIFLKDKTTNKKLSDVAEIIKGKQINGDNFSDNYEYEVYNGGITSSGKYSSYNSEKCISISEGGNSCGFVNYIEEKFWSGGHNYTLNVKHEVNDKYLFFILKAKEKQLMDLRVGSGLPNIQKSSLQNFNIYIPSLVEQNYIAKVLSSMYSNITNEKRILELYQKQKDYLLNKMFI